MNDYQLLGIEPAADEHAIKRAYSRLIKQYRPDTHPAEFADIRQAYENVMAWLHSRQRWEKAQEQDSEQGDDVIASEAANSFSPTAQTSPPVQPPSQPPTAVWRDSIQDLVARLHHACGSTNESEMLVIYREQAEALLGYTLDQQMEYEHVLLHWTLTSDKPSLLVFAAANSRYGWSQNHLAIEKMFGRQAGNRLEALREMHSIFEYALEKSNPFTAIESQIEIPKPLIALHSKLHQAQQLSTIWKKKSEILELQHLREFVNFAGANHVGLFWADFLLGFVCAGIAWLILVIQSIGLAWFGALIIGLLFSFLPMAIRSIVARIDSKPLKKREQLRKLIPRLYVAFISVLMFVALGFANGIAFLWLIAALFLVFMAESIYQFLVGIEVWFTKVIGKIVGLVLWIGKLVQILLRLLPGIRKPQPVLGGNSELKQLKVEFLAGLVRTLTKVSAFLRSMSWWRWAMIFWFFFIILRTVGHS